MRSATLRLLENDPPTLLSIATRVPPHRLDQHEVASLAPRLFDRGRSDVDRLMPVYANAGIATRYSCVPIDWYLSPHGWRERNALYLENASNLLCQSAEQALAEAGRRPGDIAAVVVASTTGIATPSLDAIVINRLGLPANTLRLPIFGLGCAGGVVGLSHAAALARELEHGDVLFLSVELCALTFRHGDRSSRNIVSSALFGDGAAAAVIGRPGSSGVRFGPSGIHTWPETLDIAGWQVEDDGLAVVFTSDIPNLVRKDVVTAVDGFLESCGVSRRDIMGMICHPGGVKVLDALEEVFGLEPGGMRDARDILSEYGNMSGATVLFVLQRQMQRGLAGRQLMTALGPGFSIGFQLLES
jgi:alkylresorcinol/alkylpyrone synthase